MAAGRMPRGNHRGRPRKLGPPPPGFVRQLTMNESIVTELTRSSIILGTDVDPGFVLFEHLGAEHKYKWRILTVYAEAYKELRAYWSEKSPLLKDILR